MLNQTPLPYNTLKEMAANQHPQQALQQAAKPYSTVIVDIEGTTTPITFVHDVLFPYVLTNLEPFLAENWELEECQAKTQQIYEQSLEDSALAQVPVLNPKEHPAGAVRHSVVENVRWQMSADRKTGPLKSLQGYMWRSAYETGKIKGSVYDDVVPAFEAWKQKGLDIYVYSSGSVEAQKLLFGWSEKGDLLKFFKGHFDTNIGMKVEASSYTKIASEISKDPATILFLSDNVREIEAAITAGFQASIVDRPGNAPLPSEVETAADGAHSITLGGRSVSVIKTFDELFSHPNFKQTAEKTSRTDRFNLEDLIHLETMFEEFGREDGLRDGAHAGFVEGRVAGGEAGYGMATEAGFYGGVAETWLAAVDKGLIQMSDRWVTALVPSSGSLPP
ncbi:HAD-like domain-containing protein [Fimicolochytrium jonesii]|uniref:HAD-like domain-containing protein n=1 Tax=Fimicolochytrium jonesii TaxID=1396493 RepID=UPI0022FDBB38|nr:HAD-like domain-containing protein [Fimicolochytrium jonesii]KAI8819682.1 HAD-like domain-containing protein [Fimicolochytrium jonesii]